MSRSMRHIRPTRRIQTTDSDLFDRLFELHAPDLLAYLVRRVEVRQDAADLLAEVFVVTWRRIDAVPSEPDARLWLFGVARKVLSGHRRGQRRRNTLAVRLRAELAQTLPTTSSTESNPDVSVALTGLSEQDRELLLLVGWDGLTPAEAATVLGIEPGTVRVRLHRARNRFSTIYDAYTVAGEIASDDGLHADCMEIVPKEWRKP